MLQKLGMFALAALLFVGLGVISFMLAYNRQSGKLIDQAGIGALCSAQSFQPNLSVPEEIIRGFSLGDDASVPLARKILFQQFPRKNLEHQLLTLFLSHRLRRQYDSTCLFRAWSSRVYMGDNEYGLTMAAQKLFNAPIEQLNFDQALALAVLVRQPSLRNHPKRWQSRQTEMRKKCAGNVNRRRNGALCPL